MSSIHELYGERSADFQPMKAVGGGPPKKKGLDTVVALSNLRGLDLVLSSRSISYVLLFGTLLGAARGGSLIDFDTDVDVGVLAQSEPPLLDALLELEQVGFRVSRVVGGENGIPNLVSVEKGGEYIDITFLLQRRFLGFEYWGYTREWYRADLLLPISELQLEGRLFPAPKKYVNLLKGWYGRKWITPVAGTRANEHRRLRNFLRKLFARAAPNPRNIGRRG